MNLQIDNQLSLGFFVPDDADILVNFLSDPEIYNNTLRVPSPYTKEDADKWISFNIDKQFSDDIIENFTIRLDSSLIGGIGFMPSTGHQSHTVEIGYWIAKPYRNQGIMSRVVLFFCNYLFQKHHFIKIIAHTYAHNEASGKVLKKCSFIQEGFLKNHYEKNGAFIDCRLYALLKC